jgi:valine--pyruvate aminotransferase
MDDMGRAMGEDSAQYMLGGGNPAHIPQVNRIWRTRMEEILRRSGEFERMLVHYDSPQGKAEFLEAVAQLLRGEYGWDLTAENIAVTNGSQSAFFLLFNMLAGEHLRGSRRKILFPQCPEYVGYSRQGLHQDDFISHRSLIRRMGLNSFKYFIDFSRIAITDEIAALCVSRPTNPTGNVITDEEVLKLTEAAGERGVPLIIDSAYGLPFPRIVFEEIKPTWNENVILCLTLSKLGLPSARTGIIVAERSLIKALSAANAIVSLTNGSLGQLLVLPLIQSGDILSISRQIIRPFYLAKSRKAMRWIDKAFGGGIDYAVHRSEGALFLWIWFQRLPVTTEQLYERLKHRGVLVVPGSYFFYGLTEPWDHSDECIRVTYSQSDDDVREGIDIIADELRSISG